MTLAEEFEILRSRFVTDSEAVGVFTRMLYLKPEFMAKVIEAFEKEVTVALALGESPNALVQFGVIVLRNAAGLDEAPKSN